jgi:1-acylglycerone phosphate reductase
VYTVIQAYGQLAYTSPIADFDMDEVKRLYAVNVLGTFEVTHAFIPLVIASGKGTIASIASVAGKSPVVFGAAYGTSKAALINFGDTLRIELAPFK